MRRFLMVTGLLAAAGVGIVGGRQLALARQQPPENGHAFSIRGGVVGLVPGRAMPLRLTIANPNAQSIRLTWAAATADAAKRSCPGDLLDIRPYTGTPQIVVPGRGQAVLELSITLSKAAPAACRQASFPLTYSGRAEQWH